MKDSKKPKKALTTEAQQTRRNDSSESSRHGSASLPIPPPSTDQMSLADDEKWLTFPKAHGHPLLPGLPNDITVANIVTKLGWRAFYALSAVSPAWCHTIRSRQIFDKRVCTGSTETLVLLCYERSLTSVPVVALYSMEDDYWFELPPLPKELGGVNPFVSRCVGLDGNVYLLEVQKRNRKFSNSDGILDTYVFDLAGQRPWCKCARMWTKGYHHLSEYGILDGKIYSVGGCGKTALSSRGSNLVYDPVKNTWSSIKPMRSLRFGHHVATVGDELHVVGGDGCDEYFDSDGNPVPAFAEEPQLRNYFNQEPTTVQIYHPLRDEWRVVSGFQTNLPTKRFFVAQGKLHALGGLGIHQYDLDAQHSALLHSVSLELLGLVGSINPKAVQVVGDEILAIVSLYAGRERRDSGICISSDVRVSGARTKNLSGKGPKLLVPIVHPKVPHITEPCHVFTFEMDGCVTISKELSGDWNGTGCHMNQSTKTMRDPGGYSAIVATIEKLRLRHKEYILAYGEGNERRLIGLHETTSVEKFPWGVANPGDLHPHW